MGVGDRQGGLGASVQWGCKGSEMTERLNWTVLNNFKNKFWAKKKNRKKKVFIANSHHTKVQLLLYANLFSSDIYLTAFIEESVNKKEKTRYMLLMICSVLGRLIMHHSD